MAIVASVGSLQASSALGAQTSAHEALARHDRAEVRAAITIDPQVSALLNQRPGLLMLMEYEPERQRWIVLLREPGSSAQLGRVVFDDATGAVVRRDLRRPGDLPPRRSERTIVAIATADPDVRRALRSERASVVGADADFLDGSHWQVDFFRNNDNPDVAVRVDVSDSTARVTGVWTGHQIAWKMARGAQYAFGDQINKPWIWWSFVVAFAVIMLQPSRLRSWRTLDIAALLSFTASHAFFNEGLISWSVPLAFPPLLYLWARCGWLFWRGVTPDVQRSSSEAASAGSSRRLARILQTWPPTWLAWVVAMFAAGARYGLNVYGSNVIDVGYAGVAGAQAILDGNTPYGNMPQDNPYGDTYGPLNYLAYVPAVLIFGRSNGWDDLTAAHATTIAADVLCAMALAWIGWRWMSARAAALLLAGWMLFPYSAFALENNVNDVIVAALLLLALASLPKAWLRGGLLAAAAAVKFVPLAALGVLAHGGQTRRIRQAMSALAAVAVVAAASVVFVASYDDGARRFWQATFGFQYERSSPFSIWGMYGWRTAQLVVQAILGVLLLAAFLRPRVRDFRQLAAGMAWAMLSVQLVLQHWFYLYIPWFFAPMLVVLVAQRETRALTLNRSEASRISPRSLRSRRPGRRMPLRSDEETPLYTGTTT